MPYYRSVGNIPAKRHTHHLDESGHRYAEELMGQEGFSSNSSLLYHRNSPSALTAIEAVDPLEAMSERATAASTIAAWGSAARRMCRYAAAHPHVGVDGRPTPTSCSGARCCSPTTTSRWRGSRRRTDSGLYRNAVGDELVFVQSRPRPARFGVRRARRRPRRLRGHPRVDDAPLARVRRRTARRCVIESPAVATSLRRPSTCRSSASSSSAPRTASATCGPRRTAARRATDDPVAGARAHSAPACRATSIATIPFDVVGWDGCVYPYAFNIHDFEPIVGRLHQPPPVHQTFEGPGFVVCSFVPRLFDFHPGRGEGAVPPRQRRLRRGAVLLGRQLHEPGRVGHRRRIDLVPPGRLRARPAARQRRAPAVDQTATEEVAVMLDTFPPLRVTDAARAASDERYPFTWSR